MNTIEMDDMIIDLSSYDENPMIESPIYVAAGNHYVVICG